MSIRSKHRLRGHHGSNGNGNGLTSHFGKPANGDRFRSNGGGSRKRVLITGGGGFIGSHLADELLAAGYEVRVLDCLSSQVHGDDPARPSYLASEVELMVGDVRDRDAVKRALKGVDAVYHFAARVGVGQSMYELADYTSTNNLGTAVLLEALIQAPVERLIVASSMSIYGEGMYRDREGRLVPGGDRSQERLKARQWELEDERGGLLTPVPTDESKPPALASLYALSKYDQERMVMVVCRAYGIPAVALRFFNVYGPRQALSNPYTGVLAIFAARLLNDKPPIIFEDGLQQRDFVSVHDVAQGCRLALASPGAVDRCFNLGSGQPHTIRDIALRVSAVLGRETMEPEITHRYRVGDVRHCFADITAARRVLDYEPAVTLNEGLAELAEWLEGAIAEDRFGEARHELAKRGLTI
jgi:dTDP-L-rhamnose 4-epimerase